MGIVKTATLIDNTAIHGKKITWAAGGGQFSMLAGPADIPKTGDELIVHGRFELE